MGIRTRREHRRQGVFHLAQLQRAGTLRLVPVAMTLGEDAMRNRQLGLGLTGLIVGAFILIVVALLGMKTLPPYLEFFTAKKLITIIANEQRGGSVADVKK